MLSKKFKIKCRRIFLAILLNEFIYSDISVSKYVGPEVHCRHNVVVVHVIEIHPIAGNSMLLIALIYRRIPSILYFTYSAAVEISLFAARRAIYCNKVAYGGRDSFRGIELYIFGRIRKIAKSDN